MIDNYDALPVGKYEALQRALTEHAEDDVNGRNLAILSILSGQTADCLLDKKLPEFRALMDRCGFLRTAPRNAQVAKFYDLKSWRLIPVLDARDMTAAQYIDFQTFAQHRGEHLAELLSCFLVPEGKKYNSGYDILQVQQAIRESLPITAALGLLAFFLRRSRESTLSTLRSSVRKLKRRRREGRLETAKIVEAEMAARMSIILLQNGAGSPMLTPLLK